MASSTEEGGQGGDAVSEEEGATHAPRKVRYCAVYDCTNSHKTHSDIGYFGFPKDAEKVKIWAEKIRRPDIVQPNGLVSSYYRVCEVHFHPRHISRNRQRRRLTQRAVPTRRLPHAGPYDVANVTAPVQIKVKGKTLVRSTLEVCEYVDEVPKPKIKRKKTTYRPPPLVAPPALEEFFSSCDRNLAATTAEFVKLVARLQTAQDSNDLCVKLLHSSPEAYRLLQASLGLPPVRALHRHCAPLLPDFDTTIGLLKTKVERMTDVEKHCTLSVDIVEARKHLYYNITFDRIVGLHEIDVTQKPWVATRGAILTARGILKKWTQPIGLCYLARDDEDFNSWIGKIISHLQTIGLKVHALVCDPFAVPPLRELSPDHSFFFVGDIKIYVLYDPPRLMKMLLCELVTYDFYFDKGSARWSDVLEYRKREKNKPLTLTPALTDASVNPAALHRMKPQRAGRILSRTLATALIDRADQGLLSESARATASFIIKLNNLYDLLNSTTVKSSSEFKKGLSQDPNQIGFLAYMKTFFKSLKLKDRYGLDKEASKMLSDNWRVTIEAVLGLQKELQPLRPYLLTHNLHLNDSVSESARRAARSLKPSCQQIFTAFKKQFFHDMLQRGQVRSADWNAVLARVVSDAVTSVKRDPMEVDDDIRVEASDYRNLRILKNSLSSAATHLLRAASRVHGDCKLAVEYVNEPPEADFLQLVQNLDEALTSALSEGVTARGLLRELLLDVHVLDCAVPCECFPLDFLKRLFFRLRLYGLLRHNQKRVKSGVNDLEIIILE